MPSLSVTYNTLSGAERKMTFHAMRAFHPVPDVVARADGEVRLDGFVADGASAGGEREVARLAVAVEGVAPTGRVVGGTGLRMADHAEIGLVARLTT